jgi:guanylate kinase
MDAYKIIILTSPSGGGKTSIARHLLQRFPQLSFSVSAATRQPRAGEVHGREYYFLSEEAFRQKIAEDAFLEWEMVYPGKYYGTLKSEIERMWKEGKVPVLDIDVIGAINVQNLYPGQCLSIFILVPSLLVLQQRLQDRGTETPESLRARLEKAEFEMGFKDQFDVVLLNDVLAKAQAEAEQVVGQFLEG